ncbi:MAG: phosphotransferase, partial [Caldilineaceae bacterium]|nr:phosphotransferase [Caldilineaceae bacterium]
MMTLRLMQDVVGTVSEQWESPLADELMQRWDYNGDSAKFWRASSNFVFFFKHAGKDCVLRFNHAAERKVATIQGEIDFVKGLVVQGIPVAKPIVSRTGNDIESVETAHGTFHAVAFEALQGEQFEAEDLTPAQFSQWGRALGKLHNASANLSATNNSSLADRPTWRDHLAMAAELIPAEETAAH